MIYLIWPKCVNTNIVLVILDWYMAGVLLHIHRNHQANRQHTVSYYLIYLVHYT